MWVQRYKNKDNHCKDPMNNDKDCRVGQSTNDVTDGFASCKLVKSSGGGLIRFYRLTCLTPRNLTDILGLSSSAQKSITSPRGVNRSSW